MYFLKRFVDNSGPLILGIFLALFLSNFFPHFYDSFRNFDFLGVEVFHHRWTPSLVVNDVLMVFFFGMAMSEVLRSVLPGGTLSSVSKMTGPIFATVGGVIGPVCVFFVLSYTINFSSLFSSANISPYLEQYGEATTKSLLKGWAVPTATDIALAWLFAKIIFGAGTIAVSFLLTLAIVDDFIGLIIIALFYPDPKHPVLLSYLSFVILGMLLAYFFRKNKVSSPIPYIGLSGFLCWYGLINANLHPALALVFVVPFLPTNASIGLDVLHKFEHMIKIPVDCFVLFLFGLLSAGVSINSFNEVSMLIFLAALLGKPLGVLSFGLFSSLFFPLPNGISWKDLLIIGQISGIALTVAIFVSGIAYFHPILQDGSKIGSLLTCISGFLAIISAKILSVGKYGLQKKNTSGET